MFSKRFFVLLLLIGGIVKAGTNPFYYVSPMPESDYNKKETTIILKTLSMPSENVIKSADFINVKGSLSGEVKGKIIFSHQENYIIFKPDKPFQNAETVTVKVKNNGDIFQFKFNIEKITVTEKFSSLELELNDARMEYGEQRNVKPSDSLPTNFPPITVKQYGQTAPGKVFLSNFKVFGLYGAYLMILNNNGSPFFYEAKTNNCYDFKKQPNGLLTYADYNKKMFYGLDTNYIVVDSFYAGNGYTTDEHELVIMTNGHYFVLIYDPQLVNMSLIIPGGDTAAVVIGLVVQELDENKNVVFQWKSWDHFSILDATGLDFTVHTIDYVHGNAIEVDDDGHIMFSSRNLDEVTKINRQTGNIIWRFGGKNNQFTLTNDTMWFYRQHSIRRVHGGKVILYDNGNFHIPKFSRAVEYYLDEVNKLATQTWQYRNTPDVYASAMGNVQRLPNGNTIIGWGYTNATRVTMTEVNAAGTKLYEIEFPNAVVSYRAFRHEYKESIPTIIGKTNNEVPSQFSLSQNYPNPFNPSTKIKFSVPENSVSENISLKIFDITGKQVEMLLSLALPAGNYEIEWNASFYSSGIYFYQLSSGNFTETKKMILLR
ncbi:MAG: aryl-sulfate sulfotransferase [Ignavibacteria bacterium]|nr:aryl-sulfate sulfotransferase [Ignavibacteria bacterium]